MDLMTLSYQENAGWSAQFPQWDSPSTLVLIFGAPSLGAKPEWLKDLSKAYPKAKIAGCSTAGEIIGDRIQDDSVSVALVRFKSTQLKVVAQAIPNAEDSFAVGERLVQQLPKEGLRAIFVLSDGLKVNGSRLVQGINSGLPKQVVVTGGLAGDGPNFKQTWVIQDGEVTSDVVTAVGFYGDKFHIHHGSKGGWDIFGPERVVTKAKANILYELDGQPALDLYKQYLGERAKELPASGLLFPLQIRERRDSTKYLVRTILAVNEEDKSLTFAGDISEGWFAQLMKANFDRLIDGASKAAADTVEPSIIAGPSLAVAISCVGRRLVLRDRAEEEVEATLEILPPGTQQIGFYSYGEISPQEKLLNCELHNQTMTLTTFGEVA